SICVVSPPCTIATSHAARCRYSSSTYPWTSSPSWPGRLAGSIRGPATTTIRSSGIRSRAADRHDADALVGPEPQSRAELLAIPEGGGVEPGDVAAERVVGVRPLA